MKNTFLSTLCIFTASLVSTPVFAYEPNWNAGIPVPAESHRNIYKWNDSQLKSFSEAGKIHTQVYPVSVTGILPPYEPVRKLLDEKSSNPLKLWVTKILKRVARVTSFKAMLEYVGLHPYPAKSDTGVYNFPVPEKFIAHNMVGFGIIERDGAKGFTFSCAACHTSNLFGKTVLGMTNRFPKANEFFVKAKAVVPFMEPNLFKFYTKATPAEVRLFNDTRKNLGAVNLKPPVTLGLDTSLAQVSLSLNRRAQDGQASYSPYFEKNPRPDAFLDHNPADSKPAVWWNLKYKNRWLSDGSVLSGNPIFTNIIWNEIGRGADLVKLEMWLAENDQIIKELTTAVFASEAPHITDFYSADKIDLARAQRGEQIFNNTCSRCHGTYEKAWSLPHAELMPLKARLKTVQVNYHANTPVINVGTDPYRYRGMKSLEQLNNLSISKANNIVIEAQEGYVPPPLVGIWARWPYLHNNSVPNLCALLTPSSQRPKAYYSGEANNTSTDYDLECGGYPVGVKTPASWKTKEHHFDTRLKGLSNRGHDEGIFLRNGQEILSAQDKRDLIKFLQTL